MDSKMIATPLKMVSVVAATVMLAACGGSPENTGSNATSTTPASTYRAEVRYTSFGVPHIKADDFGSLGYGQGYAFANDNICVLQEDIVNIRGERARYFGRTARQLLIDPNGARANSIDNDFFWKHLLTPADIDRFKSDVEPDVDATLRGFVAGYNRYMRELKAGDHPGRHAACADKDWLFEITLDDMYRRIIRLSVLASSSVFIEGVAQAQPPSANAPASSSDLNDAVPFLTGDTPFGSNMYGFGNSVTTEDSSMLFVNPHFPWRGTERLWLQHLTIPGEIDMFGVALHGAPAILIGFNNNVAWSHTVSAAYRFTLYELTLDPTDDTRYIYDGNSVAMTPHDITIDIKEPDGTITQESRRLYYSQYGPMLTVSAGLLEWGTPANRAYTLRDANFENTRLINQFFAWNKANSLAEFKQAHAEILGIPWVNTVAIGRDEDEAYYGDLSVVPNVNDAKVQSCTAPGTGQAVAQLVPGLPLLDGSRADCQWDTDNDAPVPGIFGPSNLPTLDRADYVHNCNNSAWITNPREPLTNYARIVGDNRTPRALRTRLCIKQAEEAIVDPGGLTMAELQDIVLASRVYSAEEELDNVVNQICPLGNWTITAGDDAGSNVDLTDACATISSWTRRNNQSDVGGHIWREFWAEIAGVDNLWLVPHDPDNQPWQTPNTLNTTSNDVRDGFARAVKRLQDDGVAFTTPMGSMQYHELGNGQRIALFGGSFPAGSFTIFEGVRDEANSSDGYGTGIYGNSYVQTVQFGPNGPIAEGFLTYSQSADPASPHFGDLTQRYADKNWVRWPFTDAEIENDLQSTMILEE